MRRRRTIVLGAAGWGVVVPALLLFIAPAAASPQESGDELYRDGHYDRAITSWTTAAGQGNPDAAWRLAVAMTDGVVLERDLASAARWLRIAAEAGHARAQLDLGTAYDQGWGVLKSLADAAEWYRRAAAQGEAAALLNLAGMYELGAGVPPDPAEAYAWYYLAVRQGIGALGVAGLERASSELTQAGIERSIAKALCFETSYRPDVSAAPPHCDQKSSMAGE